MASTPRSKGKATAPAPDKDDQPKETPGQGDASTRTTAEPKAPKAPASGDPTPATQDAKVEKMGGDVDAVNPESEQPTTDSEFHSERAEARIADAEESPVPFFQDEQNAEQLPSEDQLTKDTAGRNVAGERGESGGPDGDSDPEALLVDSAGELKNTGETAPTEADTAVVTSANQTQKAVGALARPEAPADQDKTAIAESPVSPPNGERVVTYTTPPRVAVSDVPGKLPKEGESSDLSKYEQRSGLQHPLVAQGQGLRTNGVTAGLETVTSGIIPDETVAETDGTVMVAGAPNETFDGKSAADGLYTGAETNAAPLQAPQPRQFSGAGETNAIPAMGAVGLQITAAPISGQIVDSATGEVPTDLDGLFVPQFTHGNVMVCTKRLVEKTSATSSVLLAHVGKQVSAVAAEQIKARIQQQARG